MASAHENGAFFSPVVTPDDFGRALTLSRDGLMKKRRRAAVKQGRFPARERPEDIAAIMIELAAAHVDMK